MQLTLDEIKKLITVHYLDSNKENAYGICPSCGHNEFGISLKDSHRFGCFRKKACGFSGNIFTLLIFLKKDIVEIKPGFEPKAKLENKLIKDRETVEVELADVNMPLGWRRMYHHPYLEQRGFTASDYEKYEVGVTKIDSRFKDMVIFKIKQASSTKGYIGRSVKSKEEIERINEAYKARGLSKTFKRYLNSDSDFSKILLGIEEIEEVTTTVILVEGLFDKQNVDKILQLDEQKEVKCCCTFKCAISAAQLELLKRTNVKTVIVMYDPDVISSINKASLNIDLYFKTFVAFSESGRDPGDMTEEDFDTMWSQLKTPNEFARTKLNVLTLAKK